MIYLKYISEYIYLVWGFECSFCTLQIIICRIKMAVNNAAKFFLYVVCLFTFYLCVIKDYFFYVRRNKDFYYAVASYKCIEEGQRSGRDAPLFLFIFFISTVVCECGDGKHFV